MNKEDLKYTHTRLTTPISTVFIAINEVRCLLEQVKPIIILDNEELKKETRLDIDLKTYNLLQSHFESIHGKDLPEIDLETLDVLSCYPIKGLEDEFSFITLIEAYEDYSIKFIITLTDKVGGGEHSIEISQEVYEALSNYLFEVDKR